MCKITDRHRGTEETDCANLFTRLNREDCIKYAREIVCKITDRYRDRALVNEDYIKYILFDTADTNFARTCKLMSNRLTCSKARTNYRS